MPSVGIGETYMEERLTVNHGTIFDFLSFLGRNIEMGNQHAVHSFVEKFLKLFRRFQQFNPISRSIKNVAHHYDLSDKLYQLFLDKDLQYSCGYFVTPETDLDSAQDQKKRHIAAKLIIEPDNHILDIGSGWGGLGMFFAQTFGARVTGVTLSESQLRISQERVKQNSLIDKVSFQLRDYRTLIDTFDRIVSVGMFEHVGVSHYQQFFRKLDNLLSENGIALLHTIGRNGPPSVTDPWLRKYIFPGGYIPALSEIMPAIEGAGLSVTDIEFLGPHYAETLKHWRERFLANKEEIKRIYDERFVRMWEFYLALSEIAFRYLELTVFQIQITKKNGIVPITRDYITSMENEMDHLISS